MTEELNGVKTGIYEFGEFRLIPSERLLYRGEKNISLSPKVFDVLIVLVEKNGHLVEKDEILERVWTDSFVEEATLARTVSRLRKSLGENSKNKFIETVSKSGYRFLKDIKYFEVEDLNKNSDLKVEKPEDKKKTNEEETSGEKEPENKISPRLVIGLGVFAVLIISLGVLWYAEIIFVNKPSKIKSIAVLPFKMIGENDGEKALKLGMADALIVKLSKLNQIIVRPTSAIYKYEGMEVDPVEVGKELKVDAVLAGNIQKDGERLRITVQLLSSSEGIPVWAENFNARSADIFTVQDDISSQVVQTLKLKLSGAQKDRLAKRHTENTEAYQAYIEGRYLWGRRNAADLEKSLQFFERAIELDPNYALAYTGIADCFLLFGEYRVMPVVESHAKARTAAQKALAIDETLAEAHASLAYTLAFYDWNFEAAEKEFKRAIELNPNYATAYQWYFEYLTIEGRFDEGWQVINKALELDPTSPPINGDIATYYYLTRQYDKTIEQARKLIELEPKYPYGYIFLFLGFYEQGRHKETVEAFLSMEKLFYNHDETTVNELREAYETSGWKAFWEKRIEIMERDRDKKLYMAWDYIVPYINIGEKEKAIEALQTSYKNRDRWIVNLKHLPQFDPIRSDPRFQEIIEKIGIE